MTLYNSNQNTIAAESPAFVVQKGHMHGLGVLTYWKAGAFNHTFGVRPVFSNATMTGRLFVMCYKA